jgi:type II secretory pathway component PulC
MNLTFSWPFILLLRRFFIFLTVSCALYAVYFMFIQSRSPEVEVRQKTEEIVVPKVVLDVPIDESVYTNIQNRNIFSSAAAQPANAGANNVSTPTGQLPAHLKVVGLVIGEPSQVIIEDTTLSQTHFISEGHPQAGISIARVNKNEIIINYQGETISLPIQNPQSSVDNATTP